LIERANRPVRDRLQFLEGLGVGTPALKSGSHTGERRAQIVRYRIADPGHVDDENLDFVQHAVCDRGKLIERMIKPRDRDTNKPASLMRRGSSLSRFSIACNWRLGAPSTTTRLSSVMSHPAVSACEPQPLDRRWPRTAKCRESDGDPAKNCSADEISKSHE
jgi:hypothetical protein